MVTLRLIAAALLWLIALPALAAERPLTVLISIDGFRPDYLDRGVSPTLSALADQGVRGDMRPSFPSKTFPNHYTLVTGLRPDRHGIVENNMQDPAIPGVTFRMANAEAVTDSRWWADGEPIWVAAERAGIRTATMFWPGSEAPFRGVRPTRWRRFDIKVPAEERVAQVLTWLDLPPAERPRFVTLYFDDVDTAGHHGGPDSAELNAAVARVDAAIGRLTAGLAARAIVTNLVIVADHGMATVPEDRRQYLDDLIPRAAFRNLVGGTIATVYPAAGQERAVENALVGRHGHFECWKKSQIPARFYYGRHPRVAPILCLADVGWNVSTHDFRPPAQPEIGQHGFDPFSPEMAAIFIANGPAFKKGARLETFDNVDVYPLLARLLGVRPTPGDGRMTTVGHALSP